MVHQDAPHRACGYPEEVGATLPVGARPVLLTLGADLRVGQVVGARRSQLNLVANTLTVYGRRTKKGTTVELTPGQRRAVEDALGGYLSLLEASCADYLLFPGRFSTSAREFTKAESGHVHKQTLSLV